MLPYQRYQKIRAHNNQNSQPLHSSLDILHGVPFWIWDRQEHLKQAVVTNQQCCFNHIVGLPWKDGKEYPLFDYEKIMYDALMTVASESSTMDGASGGVMIAPPFIQR